MRTYEPRVGTRKLHHRISQDLRADGLQVGRDRLFDVLRKRNLLVRRKKRYHRTTYSKHHYAVAQNRVRGLSIERPAQVVASDITYLSLAKGFVYLFLVTDVYSRKILGYHVSRDLSHHSALLALDMALSQVKRPAGMIHHSDRGCQYCCHEYLGFLALQGVLPSMTDASHCYQNAVAERVNGILKVDLDLDYVFENFKAAQSAVERAITTYNSRRTHWSLKLKTPDQVFSLAA